MNGIAAPIVAYEPAPTPDFVRPRRKVSVVMVVFMTGAALEESVACVLADSAVDEFVIVDNGSTRMEAARLAGVADRDEGRLSEFGFHAGELETAWMLAVAGQHVDMALARCEFPARLDAPGQLRP